MSLSARMWTAGQPVYDAILRHPFLAGLTDGSLPADRFAHYVVQDALYLSAYAKALAVVGAKAPDTAATEMFARHAAGALAVERALHESLLPELGVDPGQLAGARMSPTNEAYTSFLLASAYGESYPLGVATVLPCYWIYWEVGKALVERGSPDPRYARWIGTYADETFGSLVTEVLAVTDLQAGPGDEELVTRYADASRYEWMFWDAAWRLEQWPV